MLRFPLPQPTHHLAFSPDGRLLAASDHRGPAVRLYDSYTGRVERVLTPPDTPGPAHFLVFAPDGLRLAVWHTYATNVWSVSAGRWLCELPSPVIPPTFLPDSKRLVAVGGQMSPEVSGPEWCRLWFWAALSGNLLRDRLHPDVGPLLNPVAVLAPADGPLTVVQVDRVRRFDPDTLAELPATILPKGLAVHDAAWTAGGLVVLAERVGGRWLSRRRWRGVGVVDADGFRPAAEVPAGPAWAASPDGRQVAVTDDDTVRTVALAGGGSTALDPGVGPVTAVAFAADGLRLAAAGRQRAAVWDADG